MKALFVSDLHGKLDRYDKLFKSIINNEPKIVFMGGDLMPHSFGNKCFVEDYLIPNFKKLKKEIKNYPKILLILGNDDSRLEEIKLIQSSNSNLYDFIHYEKRTINNYKIFGYSFTPPSPFLLKDWEKFDISRYTDPGSIAPNEGKRTAPLTERDRRFITIREDIEFLTRDEPMENSVFLFHAPPYKTNLDRAALDGKMIDHIPLDLHVGSIAIKRFIETKQPMLTLHGHIHESARITGNWKDKIGRTFCFSAAHDGKELAIILFDLNNLETAERKLI